MKRFSKNFPHFLMLHIERLFGSVYFIVKLQIEHVEHFIYTTILK